MTLELSKPLTCTDMSSMIFSKRIPDDYIYRILSRERSYCRDKELNWNKRREKDLASEKHSQTGRYRKIYKDNKFK